MYKFKTNTLTIVLLILIIACKKEPKVISSTSDSVDTNVSSGIFSTDSSNENNNSGLTNDIHQVVIDKILPTKKYMYLYVTEKDNKFWIATGKKDVKVGSTYYYTGGLLKTDFESKEFNKTFDKIYLVSNIVPVNHGNNSNFGVNKNLDKNQKINNKVDIETHTEKIIPHKGSIKIADLVNDPKQYEGKTVQLTGICTKINAGIMNRNWIHIKDGSKDDFDLVVTSDAFVPVGKTFTIKALVVLNKDFGAGYSYELILEKGIIIK